MSPRLSRLISHAKEFGFISRRSVRNSEKNPRIDISQQSVSKQLKDTSASNIISEYGPYGSLMRRNLLEQWWTSTITLQDRVFPLSVVNCNGNNIETEVDLVEVDGCKEILIPRHRAFANYLSYIDSIYESEVGIAQVSTLQTRCKLQQFPFKFPFNEYLTLHYICPEKKGMHVFNRLAKQRLRWWKKFGNKQANFHQHVREGEDGTDYLKTTSEIDFEFSFGKKTVESISLGVMENGTSKNGLQFIECCTSIEDAFLTYLDDSLELRTDECNNNYSIDVDDHDDSSRSCRVLRMHPSLSPIKAIILAEKSDCEQQTDLVARLSKELKIAGISCQIMMSSDKDFVYKHADAIGTPFCFTIDERTLQRGVLSLRHRDTSIQEYMHISEVKETLLKILKFN